MEIESIVKKMTLEDKISLCSGASFWETKKFEKYGIPELFMCDGPHGLRKQEREGGADMLGVNESRAATCFPAEVTTAGSWDENLLEKVGSAIAEEAKEQNVGLVLGPGANLKRNPLCGRNFEYFSEDPYLAGKLATGFIRGAEKLGIGTSLKHFAVNSQELNRFNSDSILDGRTLRELYLTAFEIAVKEGKPSTVMCAYPKLNGIHCSDNKELLTDILREEWGYEGMVVTDWGAMNDRIEGFRAGCDLNMPGGSEYMETEVLAAVRNGDLPEECINQSVRRILKLVFQAQETLRVEELKKKEITKDVCCDYEAHNKLAQEAAEAGAVLLKNDGEILPLKKDTKVAFIGVMAKEMRYQGAGSSHINAYKLSQPIEVMPQVTYVPGCNLRGDTTEELLAEAIKVAKTVAVPVVFAGLPGHYESEGFDRDNMTMPKGHLELIEAVAEVNPNTVVVLLCGSVVECPWAEKVKGILYMGLPGQAGGAAIVNLLYGVTNPSGKLAETWPYQYQDVPSSELYGKTKDALYEEGIYVGYRYYQKAKIKVRWPFGFGLSYTNFSYSDLRIQGDSVSVTVTNTGARYGGEVVQLYMEAPQDSIHRPIRELKGFQKIFLEPGESKQVTFALDQRAYAIWQDRWVVPKGIYKIQIADVCTEVLVEGEEIAIPYWQQDSFYETCQKKPSQAEWEQMIGKTYAPVVVKKGSYTMDNTVMEMKQDSLVMKIMYMGVEKTIAKGFGGKVDYENPEFRMLMTSSAGSPLRSMQISGGIKGGLMQGLLEMANGHYLKGLKKMLSK